MHVRTTDPGRLSRAELDELFRSSTPGPIPRGRARGTAMLAAGSALDRLLRPLIRTLLWKGKVFRPETRDLKNVLSPLGLQGVRARVYQGPSWFDDQPAIIIDYSSTSLVARMVRDEIRQVARGVYLGQIFLGRKRVGHFMLELPEASA